MAIRVGFVSLSSYYLAFHPEMAGMWGGAEVQQYHVSRALQDLGFEVVTITSGPKALARRDGMRYIGLAYPRSSFSYARPINLISASILPIIPLWRSLDLGDCDIYYQRIAEWTTGATALYCRAKGRKFVFSVAHDDHCKLNRLEYARLDRHLIRLGIRKADRIFTQTQAQVKLLNENFGREGVVVPSATPMPKDFKPGGGSKVMWVGRMVDWKRPEMFLEMAKSLPEHEFVMVGGGEGAVARTITHAAKGIKNLTYLGHVPYKETLKLFEDCAVYVNTSVEEGFPNTFLHAFAIGRPVVAIDVDPDEILCTYNIGYHTRSLKGAIEAIRTLMEDHKQRRKMGQRARRYCEQNHDIKKVAEIYKREFEGLMRA